MKKVTKRVGVLTLFAIAIILWEFLSYLRIIDLARYSHPLAVIEVFGNSKFLYDLFGMIIETVSVILVGGFSGISCGAVIVRSPSLTSAVVRVLRVGLWMSFFVAWSLPVWEFDQPEVPNLLVAFTLATGAVLFAACYEYLTARSTHGVEWLGIRRHARKEIAIQGLFICLLSQVWIRPVGWNWFAVVGGSMNVAVGYAAMIITLLIVKLLNRLTNRTFDQDAELRGLILLKETFGEKNRSVVWVMVLLGIGSIVLWELLSQISFHRFVSSPLEIARSLFTIIRQGNPQLKGTVSQHLFVSLLEVTGGTILGGGLGITVCRWMSRNSSVHDCLTRYLPLTHITLMTIFPLLVSWTPIENIDPWRTSIGVGFLTFFPFLEAAWGLRDQPLLCRILLAIDRALPYGFVAMLFGEAISAVAGVGFSMVVLRHVGAPLADGMALACLLFAIWATVSCTLRFTVRKRQGR